MRHRREFDLRQVPPPQRAARLQARFEELGAGESLLLVADADLRPSLQALEAAWPAHCYWSVLEPSGTEHRALLGRTAPARRSACDYLDWEHAHLDALIAEIHWQVVQRLFGAARASYEDLRKGLERHLRVEEAVVFRWAAPQVSKAKLEALRAAHPIVRGLLGELGRSLRGEDWVTATSAMSDLREVLAAHAQVETEVLFPLLAGTQGGAALDALQQA
jgi:uncharacterized protein (DUF2249 family)